MTAAPPGNSLPRMRYGQQNSKPADYQRCPGASLKILAESRCARTAKLLVDKILQLEVIRYTGVE